MSSDNRQHIKIGTRASPMARAMADAVQQIISPMAPTVELSVLPFVAEGDCIKGSLQNYGGKGTFIKDLERRLLAGEVDCAIHSLKDIPGDLPSHPDLSFIAFLAREDPRDALVLRSGLSEEALHKGVIGTSAPRRCAALKKLYPAAEIKLCRGNVNSRFKKLDDGEYDAIVLSYAGLKRLHFSERASRIFTIDDMLPAVGQGIVAIQIRKADREKYGFLRAMNDPQSELAAKIERAMLFRLQGNCHSAIAGYCSFPSENSAQFRGIIYDPNTGNFVQATRQADISPTIETLGTLVAEDLLAQNLALTAV